ncbi:restriction endonuclease [Actinomadura latina]|uniref:site-specific DNA-methyltransferase (adenine-specific) n=1 Tax=Actinomadura latina TaxID=163603 RepID=A0A846Z466_9ACTN|nr:restriction endonuclease [Actinomadura latina]NKZ05478.1 class I SAM-dependent DNA methyltransferase [Actinomadura latina]
MRPDSLVNRGDYFSAHYLAEVLPKDVKRGLHARWTDEEKDGRVTPRRGLRALGKPYFADRKYFADFDEQLRAEEFVPDDLPEWRKKLGELHGTILRALGYEAEPRALTVRRTDEEHTVQVAYADAHLIAIECGWATDVDAAMDTTLLHPLQLAPNERIEDAAKLAAWLFATDEPPRYVLILAGGVMVLADRASWGEGRYIAVSLDVALGRNDNAELEVIAALFGADSLLPPAEGGDEPLAELLTSSRNHAVGVSKELRDGLKESVELIANEVLNRIREQGVDPEDVMESRELAAQLGRESLRYLYRILFLLYAEARPELGILPTNDQDYVKGYGLARLGDLVVRDLTGEQARNSFHLYESLDLLFRMVNKGYRPRTTRTEEGPDGEGLRFEPLRSDLFEPDSVKLIGSISVDDDEDERAIDTRLRNETLHRVLRRLMLTKGRRKERGGFISYAQLGINQLGAVYEGLMSYTGFIASEDLYEVAKNGDPKDGSWMIPASKGDDYPQDVFVRRSDDDHLHGEEEFLRYEKGSFVYRLAGRDRETSASYYTPESLTQVTVQLALKHRLDQDGTTTTAREILGWKICEPALGSGAFLNEAINQVAAEYLKRRQKELGQDIDPEKYEEELQRAKAYIALHNSYGVDLNDTAIELAEVSLWLNVMHPGLQAPWFGLHLRRGNSLIGAGRKVYDAAQLTKGTWLKEAPEEIPFREGEIPSGKVHHFLVPAEGWGAVAGAKEAKNLAPEQAKQLAAWRRKMRAKVSDKGRKTSQLKRLQALSKRAEYLWELVIQRLTISEREISRAIDVWGADWIDQPEHAIPKEKVYADLTAPGTPYWRLKTVMDAWCALWFWPLDKAGLLDGTADVYGTTTDILEPVHIISEDEDRAAAQPENTGLSQVYVTDSLFGTQPEQLDLAGAVTEAKVATGGGAKWKKTKGRKPSLDEVRRVIPLANLDDWLDFAEAVLGRADVPKDSLAHHFSGLAELEEYENQLPSWTGMDSDLRLSQRFPWLDVVEEVIEDQGFFHWELQFVQVFKEGGFDLQVGNPPWVQPTWQEGAVLAEVEPWFKLVDKPTVEEWRERKAKLLDAKTVWSYVIGEISANAGAGEFLGSGATYPLLVKTQPDLYRAFMCQVWTHTSLNGVCGLLHSDSHLTGDKSSSLRAAAYRRLRMHGDFVNAGQRFFPEPVGHATHFGVHVYGKSKKICFDHLSWLVSTDAFVNSHNHDGSGDTPGVRYRNAEFDVRPHKSRVIRVDEELLAVWRRLLGDHDVPVEQARLLFPVTIAEAAAIAALANYPVRLGQLNPQISLGYHESESKKANLIEYNRQSYQPSSWKEVILKGTQIGVSTPVFKRHDANSNDPYGIDLVELDADAVPDTAYLPAKGNESGYVAAQDQWIDYGAVGRQAAMGDGLPRRPYTEFTRMAWRKMISQNSERALYAALVPPGVAHIDGVHSLAMADDVTTALVVGFCSAVPIDYFLRATGRTNLGSTAARAIPAPEVEHPLASALLLRTLRLNCLTSAYAELWAKLYDPAWMSETWACEWPGLEPLHNESSDWCVDTPLRTERARRSVLVEIDALVAVWLGMDAEALIAAYRGRFPVLQKFEAASWFDAGGWKLASYARTIGQRQTKQTWVQFEAYQEDPENTPVPDGYEAPFYKADREAEYRQAHAVFAERLRASGWDGPIPSDDAVSIES